MGNQRRGIGLLLEEVEEGQGQGALQQIAAGWFAKGHFIAGEIEYIIHDLEGHAKVVAIVTQLLDHSFTKASKDGGPFGGGTEEAGRLRIDPLIVGIFGLIEVVAILQLVQLTIDNYLQGVAKETNHTEILGLCRKVGRSPKHIIAGQHR